MDPKLPVLVFAAGQRSGSTLLQRLLCSHPDVLIWGEDGGHLGRILATADELLCWTDGVGRHAREDFSPSRDQVLGALRQFVYTLYGAPAAAVGRRVWGLKEVRYGLTEASRLHRLFPHLALILLVRDPRDMLRSLDEWERRSHGRWTRRHTRKAVHNWRRVADGFAAAGEDGPPVLRLRYEDVIGDPVDASKRLGHHLGLDPEAFDQEVIARRRPAAGDGPARLRSWDELPSSLRQLLDPPEIRLAAQACGYEIPESAHDSRPT